MTKTISATILAGSLILSACASATAGDAPKPAAAAGRQCFWAEQVNNWTAADDEKTAYLKVGVKDVYRADLFGPCMDLDTAQSIGVRTRGGGSSICDGMDVELIVGSPLGPQRCQVSKLTKLTPEEIAALPAKLKP